MIDTFSNLSFLDSIQEDLEVVEKLMRKQVGEYHPDLEVAYNHILSAGGKRVRPAVAILTGRLLGADRNRVNTLASAIELLHTATLVHDDLIDGASLRRGIATLNTQWSPAATVLTGDFVFARAAKLAAETDSVSVMHIFAETLSTIVNGELTQMFSAKGDIDCEHYLSRIYAKTASMFELSSKATALLSLCDSTCTEYAGSYGYNVGMAFQIVDDVLDFTGEQETVGKPVASDLRQGLITIPVIYYLEEYPDDPDVLSVIGGKFYNDVLIDRVVNSIRMSGVIQRSLDEAKRYVDRGINALEHFPDLPEKKALIDLADYVVRRKL